MDEITRDETMDVKSMMEKRQSELNEYKHGDYVPGENGEAGGILIDNKEVMDKATQPPIYADALAYVQNQEKQIEALKAGTAPVATADESKPDNAEIEKRNIQNAGAMDREAMLDIEKKFSQYEMGPKGLVPAGSQEAADFNTKMEKLANGEVDLNNYRGTIMAADAGEPKPTVSVPPMEPDEGQIVQFNVPSEKTNQFISTLDINDRKKIQRTSTIVINEVNTLEVPTATRVISSMDEYKRIAPRSICEEVQECVLLNSGYVATVRGVGSLAMATLLPDQTNVRDYNKRYKFCFDNIVSTSIGKLSWQEFIANTSITDLDTLLYTILRASDPDENSILLECGVTTCKKDYEVNYKLSELLDTDKIDEKTSERINEIVAARDMLDKAKEVHAKSPVMLKKYIEVKTDNQKIVIELKSPDGTMAVERYHMFQELADQYSRVTLGIIMYVPRIYRTFIMDGESTPSTFEITDPYVIAEIIGELNDAGIQAVVNAIQTLDEFPPMTYSFKGEFRCPYCGRVEHRIDCQIDSLIFYKVGRAML